MDSLAKAREALSRASRVCVLTGAGISAESGIPTFRGPGALWRSFKPEDLATPEAFARDAKLVWEWYDWRRGLVAAAKPNPGHHAIAILEKAKKDFTLVTQNVDGLHAAAGSKNILELHGSLWTLRCTTCGQEGEDRRVPLPLPPKCACGGLLRPGVVWFGESLSEPLLAQAVKACTWAEVTLVVGTSGVVQPAASLAGLTARNGGLVVVVNPDPAAAVSSGLFLKGTAAETLPLLFT